MKNFTETFGDVCEFTFVDGPWDCLTEEPLKFFVDRKVPVPFKIWLHFYRDIGFREKDFGQHITQF